VQAAGQPTRFALALETSTAVGSVALGQGEKILDSIVLERARAHATDFLPAVAELCRRHGAAADAIEEVYVSSGPGSFTGLRVGITTARMLAVAIGAKIVAVPTLDVIAQNASDADPRPEHLVVVLDAKRGHVYTAAFAFDGQGFVATTPPVEADPAAFLASQPLGCAILGEGVLYHREAIAASNRRILDERLYPPRPRTVYRLGRARAGRGEFVDRRALIPTYIRPPEAEEVWNRRHAANGLGDQGPSDLLTPAR
jgi:tRNA threonylcarbamoyladenosine biosynthesis protein TsaB